MTIPFLTNYLDSKINENEEYIVCTFYELRVKNNISVKDIDVFLKLAKTRLENIGYNVYLKGDMYSYNNQVKEVQDNEYLVAIKKNKEGR